MLGSADVLVRIAAKHLVYRSRFALSVDGHVRAPSNGLLPDANDILRSVVTCTAGLGVPNT